MFQLPFWIDRPIALGLAFMVMAGLFLFLAVVWRRARWPRVLTDWLFIWVNLLNSALSAKRMSEEQIEAKKRLHMKISAIFLAVLTGIFLALSLLCFAVGAGIIENGERPGASMSAEEMERIREDIDMPRMR